MKKLFGSALMGAAALAAASTVNASEKIDVGLLLPYGGVYASLGKEIENGFMQALNESGMADKFNVIKEDTEVKPPVGLAKARKLVLQDKADVLVGLVSSGVLGAVRDFVDGAKVPLIVANAGNDAATGAKCSPYITRVSFSNSQVTRPMGQWMYDQGIRKVYTLGPDYAAGHQMIESFKAGFEKAGGKVVGGAYTPFRKTKDFGPYLTTAGATDAEAVFTFYAGGEAIAFVKQYDAFGLKKDKPLYGAGFLTSSLYVNAQGPAAKGVITSLHYAPTLDTPENNKFVGAFSKANGRAPSEFAVQGYDAGRTLVEAVKSGANDPASITAALSKVSYTGPRGPMKIDPKTNNVVQNIYVYETVDNGGKLTQKILGTIPNVQDEANGCKM
ncbi:ABC transporter substrate-binding protein [Sneathiella sp. P13V-1]|uniref:ABC transporter substrate-binding protein n=1 Tax=Sneathiella sp. P13V-1 TaxID=2697366 RepID=UPI00187B7BE4|nr:ABC transporter substrate-binding protein [Sneathiella sp. P13V-1]MBE7637468.1 ABC transporter substrate-binding protein [Sneathiella sp. P13V-1]